ncbi:MAG: hypothetical protein H6868_08150 [Rhodospirillales bacterium]|nr:hypothetical protein [Rhodospirillales bacterium]
MKKGNVTSISDRQARLAACEDIYRRARGQMSSAFNLVREMQETVDTRSLKIALPQSRAERLLQAIRDGRFRIGSLDGGDFSGFRPRWER